jgi:ABC-2 type transport system ATP-binding protein
MSIVEAQQLSKWFGTVRGISDITFNFEGGILGLLGPNGSGKSTLLRLLSGQYQATQGQIRIFGEPIWNNYRLMSRIGFCPEHDKFYEWQNAVAFLTYLGKLNLLSGATLKDRVDWVLTQTNLTEHAKRPIRDYSKGMRQRLKVAQSLLHDPELIILDEPLNGTDPEGRHQLVELVKSMARSGKHLIVSSHILHEVESMTDEILLLLHGHLKAYGKLEELGELTRQHQDEKLERSRSKEVHLKFVDQREREVATHLIHWDSVMSLKLASKELIIETTELESFYQKLSEFLLNSSIELEEMYIPEETLESLFSYLVG